MSKIKLAIIIPVFNEQEVITKVVNNWIKVLKNIDGRLIIINDGSTDQSLAKLRLIPSKKLIIINQKNSGHGPAIINGYKKAQAFDPEYIFQVDSDNQFITSDFNKFWNKRKKYDFIIGHRSKRYDTFFRLIITRLLRILNFLLYGNYILDANIPFRLMNKKLLKKFIFFVDPKCKIPNTLLTLIAYKIFKCVTIEVKHKERKTGIVWILGFNLIKFCFNSILELIDFRIKKYNKIN